MTTFCARQGDEDVCEVEKGAGEAEARIGDAAASMQQISFTLSLIMDLDSGMCNQVPI
jgi:hypothetical protein